MCAFIAVSFLFSDCFRFNINHCVAGLAIDTKTKLTSQSATGLSHSNVSNPNDNITGKHDATKIKNSLYDNKYSNNITNVLEVDSSKIINQSMNFVEYEITTERSCQSIKNENVPRKINNNHDRLNANIQNTKTHKPTNKHVTLKYVIGDDMYNVNLNTKLDIEKQSDDISIIHRTSSMAYYPNPRYENTKMRIRENKSEAVTKETITKDFGKTRNKRQTMDSTNIIELMVVTDRKFFQRYVEIDVMAGFIA